MKIKLRLAAFLFFAIAVSTSFVSAHEGHEHGTGDPNNRAWTFSDSGAHLHASYVASSSGKVQLRRVDGKIITLEIAKLAPKDQQWIEQKATQVKEINEVLKVQDQLSKLVSTNVVRKPAIADTFEPFARLNAIKYQQDDNYFYVESDSMPDHRMMVGITAWQQQVPIPQSYFGENAWRIPLEPKVAKEPLSAKSNFFRGAIALAANGVPIFNPIKNDGRTDTLLAGELDEFGGHCGRGDDYHYHIAPTHLQKIVGDRNPIAYALDGYPIYGFTEPDGSPVKRLDSFNGHSSPELGYHYHATKTYPYLNGGFHGEVVQRDGQVDPQPRAGGVREALAPLRGAKITGFERKDSKNFSLKIEVGRETRYVNYMLNQNGSVTFDFVDGKGKVETETYSPRQRGPGRPQGGERMPPDRPNGNSTAKSEPLIISPPQSGKFKLSSPSLKEGEPLPNEFNGNGEGATPPLQWTGVPKGTKSFALLMDHIDRDNIVKTYWNIYAIPASVNSIEKNAQEIGTIGATWKRDQPYVPPHSAGGGKQTYTIHLYALSVTPQFTEKDGEVTREVLLTKIRDKILDSAVLNVTYQRPPGEAGSNSKGPGGKGPNSKGPGGRGANGKRPGTM